MSKQDSSKQRHREYLQSVRVAGALLDGPRTLDEIAGHFYSYLRVMGLFQMTERRARSKTASISEKLVTLLALSWIEREDGRFALTPHGRVEVERRLSELGETGKVMCQFLQPEVVSIVTLGVYLGLAAFKLQAGYISGSVGLLNDAAEPFLDGISRLLLYLVEKQGVETRTELVTGAHKALNFNRIPAVQTMGLAQQQLKAGEMIARSLGELFEHGWLTGEQRPDLTAQRREHLRRQM